ncbi:DUF262 domain-containing protein [Pontixanthobacter gangjinensis]|uniref:DUF262 domain-containing protein n=1 Tax=Christiangramia aestuarii TaxID=1028746 RepID=A0A7K1LT39_9FLAO|nr:DUF262 domain-containing protein [Christiangramia aestuarii]MUP43947.1 DUF262 domain-containing protein [Christiangramia aestuarii]
MAKNNQLDLFTNIIDDTEEEVLTFRYEISNYGADYPVDSLVKRLRSEAIFVPPFQRRYVWNKFEASKFIESLLLGLPVPGVFLSKEPVSNKLLIVDGQQRLLSLMFFYDKKFKDGSEFKLVGVQQDLEGKTYDDLNPSDQHRLDDSIIHSTIIKQEVPDDDESSIYQIFERINSGGRPLSPQEIRACIYYGKYNELLVDLAMNNEVWRKLIGGEHNDRLKEEELILRYFSLLFHRSIYQKPMKEFLNKHMALNRNLNIHSAKNLKKVFNNTISYVYEALGKNAFRLQRGVHSAIFDSVMIGVTERIIKKGEPDIDKFKKAYEELIENKEFKKSYTSATSDENSVEIRINLAVEKFMSLD